MVSKAWAMVVKWEVWAMVSKAWAMVVKWEVWAMVNKACMEEVWAMVNNKAWAMVNKEWAWAMASRRWQAPLHSLMVCNHNMEACNQDMVVHTVSALATIATAGGVKDAAKLVDGFVPNIPRLCTVFDFCTM